jgi:hypothetical protein
MEDDPLSLKGKDGRLFQTCLSNHCPVCGMDGTLKLIETLGYPTYLYCIYCDKWIYEVEIIKRNFDPANSKKESFVEFSKRRKLEQEEAETKKILDMSIEERKEYLGWRYDGWMHKHKY